MLESENGDPRYIPLNSVALAAFKRLRPVQKANLRDHPSASQTVVRDAADGGSVFVSIHGEGDPLRGYKHWFDPAVEAAGLRDFTWYCMRRTFASRLVMDGVDLVSVRDFMGHKNIQMTMLYAHLAPAHRLAAIERLVSLGKAVKGSKSPKPTDTMHLRPAVSC